MKSVCVHLKPDGDINQIWSELELMGLNILYSSEDNDTKCIYANLNDADLDNWKHESVISITPFTLPPIDWEQQFRDHGLDYHDGYVHVNLKEFNCLNPKFNPIKIEPGPGFGDLSHETTKLILKLMNGHIENRDVLDVGCGSGILSFAAVSMGAKSVFGIDIDSDAISHSLLNRKLNHMDDLISFAKSFTPEQNQNSLLVLMNMIHQEQIDAWGSLKNIHESVSDCFTSGILKKDRARYLSWAKKLKMKLVSEKENKGWLAFHFKLHGMS